MSSRFQYVNFIGVLALAILCVVQWKRDRALNLEVNRLEKARMANEQTIADQDKTIRGLNSDLTLFKGELMTTRTNLSEALDKLRFNEAENSRLALECDQLRESITNWAEAVSLRDERLKEANASIQDLADRLNDSIQKFNELATNYNAVVDDLNALRSAGRTNSAEAKPPRKG